MIALARQTSPAAAPAARRSDRFGPLLPILTLAAIVHAAFWPIVPSDMVEFMLPWLRHIVAHGPVGAFAIPFSNYSPPYLYLLALVSPWAGTVAPLPLLKGIALAGALLLAASVRRLARLLEVAHPERVAASVLLLPGVVLGAALLAQIDSLFAAPLVMAVAAAIERGHRRMFLWCGLAVAIKLQAIFVGPFFLALAIRRRVPLASWSLAPLALILAWAPAALAGWPLGDLATIYLRQSGYYPQLSLNAPNIWAIVQPLIPGATQPWNAVAFTAATIATGAYLASIVRRPLDPRGLVAAAALAAMLVAGLLPHMHERYFFVADILTFLWAAAGRSRRDWITAALVQAGSALATFGFASGTPILVMPGAIAMIVATIRLARSLTPPADASEPLPIRADGATAPLRTGV